jgi:alpha-tubulin suppressor-like RCC1 family protein
MTSGAVKCWGNNNSGQLGSGVVSQAYYSPADVVGLESGVTAISAGLGYSCALRAAGDAVCWGSNRFGNLGDGTVTDQPTPTPVVVQGLPTGQITSIMAGGLHTCAIVSGGAAKCWGLNTSAGKLGDGTGVDRYTPVDVVGMGSGTAAIATAILHHTCAMTTDGGLRCWGYNGYGQVGDGTTTNRLVPTTVVLAK